MPGSSTDCNNFCSIKARPVRAGRLWAQWSGDRQERRTGNVAGRDSHSDVRLRGRVRQSDPQIRMSRKLGRVVPILFDRPLGDPQLAAMVENHPRAGNAFHNFPVDIHPRMAHVAADGQSSRTSEFRSTSINSPCPGQFSRHGYRRGLLSQSPTPPCGSRHCHGCCRRWHAGWLGPSPRTDLFNFGYYRSHLSQNVLPLSARRAPPLRVGVVDALIGPTDIAASARVRICPLPFHRTELLRTTGNDRSRLSRHQ